MSRVICVVPRDSLGVDPFTFELLNRRLTPDNIDPNPASVMVRDGIALAILNPAAAAVSAADAAGLCLGFLVNPAPDWWRRGAAVPDGSYILFRGDCAGLEILNDIVASRTVWYVLTERAFLASTSQRALVTLLGSYRPNHAAFPWMLSTGSLGSGHSWDERIHMLPPWSQLRLDRKAWTVEVEETEVSFEPAQKSARQHRANFEAALDEVIEGIDLDPSEWALPLSGGVDSRALLLMLRQGRDLRCVTWGVKEALLEPENDAHVAARLADRLELDHRFFELDETAQPFEVVLDRFLVASEGRVDSIAGYMDGFAVWRWLFDEGMGGVIRGDQLFGLRLPVYTADSAARYLNLVTLSHFANVPTSLVAELPSQEVPAALQRRPNEPILTWRDRLYHTYRAPLVLSALTDCKCAYVEVINPFLANSLVEQVRRMPGRKRIGRQVILDRNQRELPGVAYAEKNAIPSTGSILASTQLAEAVTDELGSSFAISALPDAWRKFLMAPFEGRASSAVVPASRGGWKYALPPRLRNRLMLATKRPREILREKRGHKPSIDVRSMAFRGFLISRMQRMLEEDAKVLAPRGGLARRSDV